MIKEKHEKGSDSVKEESVSANKEPLPGTNSIEVQIKKEDDVATKKEPSATAAVPITKNGGLVGSTNTGSIQTTPDLKTEAPSEDPVTTAVSETVSLKQEDSVVGNDPLGDPFGLGLGPPGPPTTSSGHPPQSQPESVQALGSNVINKQSSSMEVQYMQQQSQIFVFSTVLANTGADEVLQGHYSSIIAYHCAQPGTKKYLEKNPLKVTQFNRQHPVQWLNNFAMMKNKGCTRSPSLGPKAPPIENFLGPETLEDMVGLGDTDAHWDQKSNHQLEGLEGAVTNGLPDMGPDMDSCSPSLLNVQPKLQGVQVPDENLTPQQRQHREERLASIRKMQQMLFPESQTEGAAGHQEGMSGISPGGAAPLGPGSGVAPPGQPPVTAQMEWQKLQSQFFDDRTKIKPQQPPPSTASNPSCSGSGGPLVPVGPVSGSGQPPTSQSTRAGPSLGPRLQGPPPPYHQTQRSASVPIALQSPNPTSPNNPTSNLSLPSPRTSSALNSPADPNRPFGLTRHMSTGQSPTSQDSPSAPRLNHSNPSTPLSSHLSPSVTSSSTEPSSTSTHQSSDGMFGRTLQSMAQQKQQINTSTTSSCSTLSATGAVKEPNLMPVPSPQQIQYLNTFEGQELIIQKQPNTSLKDGNIISPPVLSTSLDSGFPGNTPDLPHSRVSGPNTPTSMDTRFPPTPGVSTEGCRFQIPSPHTPTATSSCSEKPPQRISGPTTVTPGMSPQTVPGPTSDPLKNDLFPTPSPHMMDMPRFPGPNASPGSQNKMGSGFGVNVSPQGKPNSLDLPGYCAGGRNDNIPLNPNCTSSMVGNLKQSHFDPISSLAQMSQQLTNSAASNLNGQPGQGPVMMSFGSPSMHMMDMSSCHGGMGDMDGGGMMGINAMQGPPHGFHPGSPMGHMRSHSPKLSGAFPNHLPMQRMMVRAPGPGPSPFNGANVQVKPNAPNTIQYLPAKGQGGAAPTGPRGPPSLDFLTRLASPMNPMMDASKMQSGPGQYFQGGGPGPMQGSPMGHMGHMEGGPGMGQEPPMMGPMGVHMGNGTGSPMMGGSGGMGMGSGGPGPGMMPMMRGGPAGMRPMMRVPQMGFGPGGPDGMFPGGPMGPGPNNPQMFVAGPKGSPMGMAPDASQPLPPSMGQGGGFKGAPFVGPTTSDPNYAQQYHNFQQQLYATNTRSQMGGVAQNMGPGPGPPPHMQHLP
ncbi:protein BCL9 homolog isoform X2 [Anthonomus grandis grandis]|uniref:protein BCL9 homolog isoform X2 n=1 Tax=Anthonomus grandis grandis TaxID=2921223 RepID=UPI0021656CD9|nr:protein BCL9 homolog isoform X2 [Anthonomus grandis grandis]